MKDLFNHLQNAKVLGPVVLAADNTPVGIDLQDALSAMLELDIGIGGITFTPTDKIEFVVTHSDDDSNYTSVTDDDIQGATGIANGIVFSLIAAHAAAAKYHFGYIGGKRYVRVLADFSGTHGVGTPIAINVLKGDLRRVPAD